MHSRLMLAGLLLAATSPLFAQQQTVEGAQSFLSKIVEQGGMTVDLNLGKGWNVVPADKSYCRYYGYDTATGIRAGEMGCSEVKAGSHTVEPYPLTVAKSLSTCVTQIDSPRRFSGEIQVPDSGRNYWIVWPEIPNGPFRIDWSAVAEVKQAGSSVTVLGPKPTLRFELQSEQLAARVAFAMEFLRMNCDATAGTGF